MAIIEFVECLLERIDTITQGLNFYRRKGMVNRKLWGKKWKDEFSIDKKPKHLIIIMARNFKME